MREKKEERKRDKELWDEGEEGARGRKLRGSLKGAVGDEKKLRGRGNIKRKGERNWRSR